MVIHDIIFVAPGFLDVKTPTSIAVFSISAGCLRFPVPDKEGMPLRTMYWKTE